MFIVHCHKQTTYENGSFSFQGHCSLKMATYSRRQPGLNTQFPGEPSDAIPVEYSSDKGKKKIKRFLQYLLPPFGLVFITLTIFAPSYQSDPVSFPVAILFDPFV